MWSGSLFLLLLQPVSARGRGGAVFVDGGYAGTVGKLKSLHLRPGTYSIELRGASATPYTERVYVAAGKTVRLNPNRPIQP